MTNGFRDIMLTIGFGILFILSLILFIPSLGHSWKVPKIIWRKMEQISPAFTHVGGN